MRGFIPYQALLVRHYFCCSYLHVPVITCTHYGIPLGTFLGIRPWTSSAYTVEKFPFPATAATGRYRLRSTVYSTTSTYWSRSNCLATPKTEDRRLIIDLPSFLPFKVSKCCVLRYTEMESNICNEMSRWGNECNQPDTAIRQKRADNSGCKPTSWPDLTDLCIPFITRNWIGQDFVLNTAFSTKLTLSCQRRRRDLSGCSSHRVWDPCLLRTHL